MTGWEFAFLLLVTLGGQDRPVTVMIRTETLQDCQRVQEILTTYLDVIEPFEPCHLQ